MERPVPLVCRLPRPLARAYWGWCCVAGPLVSGLMRIDAPGWCWWWALSAAGVRWHSESFGDWFDRGREVSGAAADEAKGRLI